MFDVVVQCFPHIDAQESQLDVIISKSYFIDTNVDILSISNMNLQKTWRWGKSVYLSDVSVRKEILNNISYKQKSYCLSACLSQSPSPIHTLM